MKRALLALPLALALLAGAVLLARSGDEPGKAGEKKAVRAPRKGPGEAPGRAPQSVVEEQLAKIFESSAREGPDSRAIVDRLRKALAELSEEDTLLAKARLAKFLEENPAERGGLLSAFEAESDPDVLLLLAQTFGGDAASMADPAVAEAMTRIAGSEGLAERRGAACLVLANLADLDERAVNTVFRLVRDEAHGGVRIDAIGAIAGWMQRFPESAAAFSRQLVGTARGIADPEIRGHAIQAVALLDRGPDADTVFGLAGFLKDGSEQNRALAAMGLGAATGDARASAAKSLEGAVLTESREDTQRGMLIHLVRAAGPDAAETLARVAAGSPRLAADVKDFLEILQTEREPLRVWELKQQRDLARGEVPGADEHSD